MDTLRIIEPGSEEAVNIASRMLFENKESEISSFYNDKFQIVITTEKNVTHSMKNTNSLPYFPTQLTPSPW